MEKELADKALEIANEESHDVRLYDGEYDNYSGRCMYGKTTTALVVDAFWVAKDLDDIISAQEFKEQNEDWDDESDDHIIRHLQEVYPEDYKENELKHFRSDSLGLSMLIY
jgi:hypothetical protein